MGGPTNASAKGQQLMETSCVMQARQQLTGAATPRLRWGVVVHEPGQSVDGLLAEFALTLKDRGFKVSGYVQCNNEGSAGFGGGCASEIALCDLAAAPAKNASPTLSEIAGHLGETLPEDADLAVVSRFSAFEKEAAGARRVISDRISRGVPFLTSIAGRCIGRCEEWVDQSAAMLHPNVEALWLWWGPERLYRDLALGVADDEVRQIVCGPRWVMVEGPHGAGLAYLPRSPKHLLPRLPFLQRQSLRALAALSQSWDPLDMALAIAAMNAHYNRFDLEGRTGNGVSLFRRASGRVVAIGAFRAFQAFCPIARSSKPSRVRANFRQLRWTASRRDAARR